MTDKSEIRWAVVGIGAMGTEHANRLLAGEVHRGRLAAVIHADAKRRAAFAVAGYGSIEAMAADRAADAVVIAAPQTAHADLARRALAAGLHVMVEKPLALHHAEALEMTSLPRRPGQHFGVMMNQRMHPAHRAVRQVIRDGWLGRLQRVTWTVTDWFRTNRYFTDRPWRGTWAGEGGGVLINQALHQLDLYCWFFGRPSRVVAHCGFGRYHDIETEDDVAAHFEHENGLRGTFITSTGEAPGANRLEIVGERGRLVMDGFELTLWQNAVSSADFLRDANGWFDVPACERVSLPEPPAPPRTRAWGGQHAAMLENFTEAALDGAALIAPAEDGVVALEVTNAIQLSSWLDRPVTLPLDDALYHARLAERMRPALA